MLKSFQKAEWPDLAFLSSVQQAAYQFGTMVPCIRFWQCPGLWIAAVVGRCGHWPAVKLMAFIFGTLVSHTALPPAPAPST